MRGSIAFNGRVAERITAAGPQNVIMEIVTGKTVASGQNRFLSYQK
ncbi:hypothetical protein S7335_3471 [Synechococcus sp. PCC 7335]|nr:hypothetical protein S7335_3471 [Synechococcus sp. PCC 7335]